MDMTLATRSVTRFADDVLANAVRLGANDIHVERSATRARLRYRLDGVLTRIDTGDYLTLHYAAVISRLKVLAAMDIAEHRLPQDGRFAFRCQHGEVDVRASTLPVEGGEKIALRLFAREEGGFDLERLGLSEKRLETVCAATSGRHGMILVAGPTGSGKTTTLYALLNRVNADDINVLTAEDPIERRIEGVNQCEVRNEINLTFARLLRAFLRQDPEVMMIGEIRDAETADIAVKAALTGHLVLSTVHSGGAVGALQRLIHLGVEPASAATAVRLVLAQRLLRRICAKCAEPDPQWRDTSNGHTLMRGAGCEACAQTGCRGRTGVFEMATVRESSGGKAWSPDALQPETTIAQSAAALVRAGKVSVAEHQRVLGDVPAGVAPKGQGL